MKRLLITTAAIVILGGCASMIDHQTQIITMRTPGAENARCVIENQDMKYIVRTDETVEIMKSPHDLVVRCQAPGNREKTVLVKRTLNEWLFVNVANGFVPGAAYDYFSRGMFDYPPVFTVSFVGVPVTSYPLPQHHTSDLDANHQNNHIEYMGPGEKITDETRYERPYVLDKKEGLYEGNTFFEGSAPSTGSGSASGGGSAGQLDAIHQRYNPGVSSYNPSEEDK